MLDEKSEIQNQKEAKEQAKEIAFILNAIDGRGANLSEMAKDITERIAEAAKLFEAEKILSSNIFGKPVENSYYYLTVTDDRKLKINYVSPFKNAIESLPIKPKSEENSWYVGMKYNQ